MSDLLRKTQERSQSERYLLNRVYVPPGQRKPRAAATPSNNRQTASNARQEFQQTTRPQSMHELRRPRRRSSVKGPSPQEFLEQLLMQRGYSTERFCALESGYYIRPSDLQMASYAPYLVERVRQSDAEAVRSSLEAGLSANPCNAAGESLVHMVCRRADLPMLQVFMEFDCDLQIADDFGRTPLHDACWAADPSWEMVQILLDRDARLLFMTDIRESVPLQYVRKDHWPQWIDFLQSVQEKYWPLRTQEEVEGPPPLALEKPNSWALPLPKNALTLDLAQRVASGRMKRSEAQFIHMYDSTELTVPCSADDASSSSSNSSEDDEQSEAALGFYEESMEHILRNLAGEGKGPLPWADE